MGWEPLGGESGNIAVGGRVTSSSGREPGAGGAQDILTAWPAAQHRSAAGQVSLILRCLGLAVGTSGRSSSSISGQEQVSLGLGSYLQCLAGIGLAKRLHSAVPLVDSVFFPDEGADHSLFNYSNEFSKLVAEEYLSFFDFTGLTLDKALR